VIPVFLARRSADASNTDLCTFFLSGFAAVILLAIPSSAPAQHLGVYLKDPQKIGCIEADLGEYFEISIFVEDLHVEYPHLNDHVGFSLRLPEGLVVVSCDPDPTGVSAGHCEKSFERSYSLCRYENSIHLLDLALCVRYPLHDATISISAAWIQEWEEPKRDISGGVFYVNPSDPCSGALDVDVIRRSAFVLPDHSRMSEVLIQNSGYGSFSYVAHLIGTGSGTEWFRFEPAGTVAARSEELLPGWFDARGLTVGTYTADLELQDSVSGNVAFRGPVNLVVLEETGGTPTIDPCFDEGGTSCDREASEGDLVDVNVWARLDVAMTAAEFRVEAPPGVTYMGESYGEGVSVSSGNVLDGVQLALRYCDGPSLLLAQARFLVTSDVREACFLIRPHPVSSFLGTADCTSERALHPAGGTLAVLNGDCNIDVPVKHETCGRIKARYRK
jgi:hypothetical protein